MGDVPLSTKIDRCQGHDACRPRAFSSASPNVTAEGIEVVRQTDSLVPHGCDDHAPHGAAISKGHPTVEANGLPVGHVGACVSCQSREVATGRSSVVVGAPAPTPDARVGTSEASLVRKVSDKPTECRGQQLYQQKMKNSCAMASSRMVIAQMTGKPVTEEAVQATGKGLELYHPPSGKGYGAVYQPFAGTMPEGIPGVLGAHGVEAHSVETPAKVDQAFIDQATNGGTTPAIFAVAPGHAIVVDGVDASGNVLVRDPWPNGAAGCQKIPLAEFAKEVQPGTSTTVMGKAPEGEAQVFSTRSLAK